MKRVLIFSLLIIFIVGCQKNEPEDIVLQKTEQPGGYFYIGEPNTNHQKLVDAIVGSEIEFQEPLTFVFDTNGILKQIINNSDHIYTISIEKDIIRGEAEFDYFKRIFEFNNKLNLISNYQIDIITGEQHGLLYEYDEQNRIIRKEVLSDNLGQFDLYIYEYHENGNFKVTTYKKDVANPWYFEYNSLGNLIWQCWVNTNSDDDPDNDEYRSTRYDNANNIIREERRHFADSAIFWFAIYEFLDNGEKRDWTYRVQKEFAMNTENPAQYKYSGDSILYSYNEYNASGIRIKQVFSTIIGNLESDVTRYYFIHIMREYDDTGRETSEIHYIGDFRYNLIEYRYGDYIYNETNNLLAQRIHFDSDNKSIYRYTSEYVFDASTSKYIRVRLNCIDVESGQLLWYIDEKSIKRKPDGSVY